MWRLGNLDLLALICESQRYIDVWRRMTITLLNSGGTLLMIFSFNNKLRDWKINGDMQVHDQPEAGFTN